MTGAPPTTSDCNRPLTGASGIGSTDLFDDGNANDDERELITCWECDGDGIDPANGDTCWRCRGKGECLEP